jgi:hypothetical protein
MTNCLDDFQEYTELTEPITVHTADAQVQLQAMAIDTVKLGPDMPSLTRTLYVPGLAHKLFSLSKILDKGYSTKFSASHFYVLDSHGSRILSGLRHGDLYYIQQAPRSITHANTVISCNPRESDDSTTPDTKTLKHIPTQVVSPTIKEWHEVLGHISKEAIIRTCKAVKGMIISDTDLPFCDACALSKAKKIPFPYLPLTTTCMQSYLAHRGCDHAIAISPSPSQSRSRNRPFATSGVTTPVATACSPIARSLVVSIYSDHRSIPMPILVLALNS